MGFGLGRLTAWVWEKVTRRKVETAGEYLLAFYVVVLVGAALAYPILHYGFGW